jgi:hypothetical protein
MYIIKWEKKGSIKLPVIITNSNDIHVSLINWIEKNFLQYNSKENFVVVIIIFILHIHTKKNFVIRYNRYSILEFDRFSDNGYIKGNIVTISTYCQFYIRILFLFY